MEKEEKRGKSPQALKNRPELFPDLSMVHEAFNFACGSRQISDIGMQALSVTEISATMDLMGIRGLDERYRFATLLQAMDREMLDWQAAKRMEKQKNADPSTRDRQPPRKARRG